MSRYPSPAPEPARVPKPQRPDSTGRWLNARQAAEFLGVSENSIRSWKDKGLISYRRVGPKLIKFDVSDLEEVWKRFEKNS